MVVDTFNSIKATLYDRLHSPFFGSFIISWILVNHKILIVLFSSLGAIEKINYLDEIPAIVKFFNFFMVPFSISMFYMFIYPNFEKMMYEVWREHQNQLKLIKIAKDEGKALDENEARELKRHHLDLMKNYDESHAILKSENDSLRKNIDSSDVLIRDMKSDLNKVREENTIYSHEVKALKEKLKELEGMNSKLSDVIDMQKPLIEKYHEIQIQKEYVGEMDFSQENIQDIKESFEKIFLYLIGIVAENERYAATVIEFDFKNGSAYENLSFLYLAKILNLTTIHKNGKMSLTKMGYDIIINDISDKDIWKIFDEFLKYIKENGTGSLKDD